METIVQKFNHRRWVIADYLSYLACKLRGQKWYVQNTMSGTPGNRAAELKQSIWERCVVITPATSTDLEWLNIIKKELGELGQLAGENWGHSPHTKA